MGSELELVTLDEVEMEYNERAGAYNGNLITELGCENMRPRVWKLGPGEAMSYHRHQDQEELYYVVKGPGRIRVCDTYHDVPTGVVTRLAPEKPRQLLNDTNDQEHIWLVIGAPAIEQDGIHL